MEDSQEREIILPLDLEAKINAINIPIAGSDDMRSEKGEPLTVEEQIRVNQHWCRDLFFDLIKAGMEKGEAEETVTKIAKSQTREETPTSKNNLE